MGLDGREMGETGRSRERGSILGIYYVRRESIFNKKIFFLILKKMLTCPVGTLGSSCCDSQMNDFRLCENSRLQVSSKHFSSP